MPTFFSHGTTDPRVPGLAHYPRTSSLSQDFLIIPGLAHYPRTCSLSQDFLIIPGLAHYRGFMITLRHTTLGRTPLDERSARCTDLYLTTHNTHRRQISVPPAEFEPTIPASKRPQKPNLKNVFENPRALFVTSLNLQFKMDFK